MPLPSRQLRRLVHRLGAVKGAERVRGSKREAINTGIRPQVDRVLLMVAASICKGMNPGMLREPFSYTDAATTKAGLPSSKLAKESGDAATAAGAGGGGTAPSSAALVTSGGPSLEAPKDATAAVAGALGKPQPETATPLLAPKRNQSRSARRKATKRMLRRTGVLPYAGSSSLGEGVTHNLWGKITSPDRCHSRNSTSRHRDVRYHLPVYPRARSICRATSAN